MIDYGVDVIITDWPARAFEAPFLMEGNFVFEISLFKIIENPQY